MEYTVKQIELIERKLNSLDTEGAFDDMLDDVYGLVNIAGLEYSTSRALKETDPTAYRCYLAGHIAGLEDYIEINGEYYLESEVEVLIEQTAYAEAQTNLEKAQAYFKRAYFDMIEDKYTLDGRYEIEWTGECEGFVVNEGYDDSDVGYVSNPEMFAGDFDQCLKFVLDLTGGVK